MKVKEQLSFVTTPISHSCFQTRRICYRRSLLLLSQIFNPVTLLLLQYTYIKNQQLGNVFVERRKQNYYFLGRHVSQLTTTSSSLGKEENLTTATNFSAVMLTTERSNNHMQNTNADHTHQLMERQMCFENIVRRALKQGMKLLYLLLL